MTERRLTLNDPVSKDDRELLQQLSRARTGMAEQLLTLELERINLIAAGRRIDNQNKEVFRKILVDRGQSPDLVIEIDVDSGAIKMQRPEQLVSRAPEPEFVPDGAAAEPEAKIPSEE